jgi:hypothetical protein
MGIDWRKYEHGAASGYQMAVNAELRLWDALAQTEKTLSRAYDPVAAQALDGMQAEIAAACAETRRQYAAYPDKSTRNAVAQEQAAIVRGYLK